VGPREEELALFAATAPAPDRPAQPQPRLVPSGSAGEVNPREDARANFEAGVLAVRQELASIGYAPFETNKVNAILYKAVGDLSASRQQLLVRPLTSRGKPRAAPARAAPLVTGPANASNTLRVLGRRGQHAQRATVPASAAEILQ
jgi:hypothetical protein